MADLNFIWHGLVFEWRGSDHRFDNYNQGKERWATASAHPVGKLWRAALKFERCEGYGDGATPEQALEAAFEEIEDAVVMARAQMQDEAPSVEQPMYECSMCSSPATRMYSYGDGKTFYCDRHAEERIKREAERWSRA